MSPFAIRSAAACLSAALCAGQLAAEKKVTVKIEHSAPLRAALAGRAAVAGPVNGPCAAEFAALLSQDLAAHQVSVATDDRKDAIRIGVNIAQCDGRPLPPTLGPGLPAMHIARTEGRFRASVRAVDGTNGRELASAEIRGDAQKQNESQTGAPEHPSPPEIRALAMRNGLARVRRLYAPWKEEREIAVMDNKECNLRSAYESARSGNYTEMWQRSRANVESCRSNAKYEGAAWYNLGVAALLVRRYDDALSAFSEAAKANGPKVPQDLLELCKVEAAARAAVSDSPAPGLTGPAPESGIRMTEELILKMLRDGVDDAAIIQLIETQPAAFSVAPERLAVLEKAGASAQVIAAMRKKAAGAPPR